MPLRPLATCEQAGALMPADFDVALHLLQLLFECDGAELRVGLDGMPAPDLARRCDEPIEHLVVDTLLDKYPGTRDARLAASREYPSDYPRFCSVQVCVSEDDVRRLSS